MIKQFEFATRRSGVTPAEFATVWRPAASVGARAPQGVRPRRIVVCPVLSGEVLASRHGAVAQRWFDDADHLERFEHWRAKAGARQALDDVTDPVTSPVVVAEESVLRGGEWLEHRWREGGKKLKHMALARRAADLTPAEFSARWRERAGTVKRAGESSATVIPDEARGLAYVQNHPLPVPLPVAGGEWAYDAINEVYFDDHQGLRKRMQWFEANVGEGSEDDLFEANWYLCLREDLLPVEEHPPG